MIFLSLLAKTYALALGPVQMGSAIVVWVASIVLDLVAARRTAEDRTGAESVRKVVFFNLAALVIGLATADFFTSWGCRPECTRAGCF